jgi:hypothetical protein
MAVKRKKRKCKCKRNPFAGKKRMYQQLRKKLRKLIKKDRKSNRVRGSRRLLSLSKKMVLSAVKGSGSPKSIAKIKRLITNLESKRFKRSRRFRKTK